MAIVLDGKKLSEKSEKDFVKRVSIIKKKTGSSPILATILVGDNPASATYVNMKGNACRRIGMESLKIELPETTSTEELIKQINVLNDNKDVHGILLQHPVPSQIDERKCFDAIKIEKDVDGVTSLGFGKMSMQERVFGSCTPYGIMRLLDEYKIELEGKSAVVVGRSPILGKPMAMMLLNRNCTVTICHSKTQNLKSKIGDADIIVGAVGIPQFIKGDWIKNEACLLYTSPSPRDNR